MPPSSPFRPPQPLSSRPSPSSINKSSTSSLSVLRRTPSVSPGGSGGARVGGSGGAEQSGGVGAKQSVAQIKLEKLRREVRELEEGLGGADPDQIVKRHIHLLHLYNERKLAALDQVPAREVQARLGIEADD
ncbi:hypothetical protein JCM11251_000588 [Rhodosporidiobolus azoricus]